LLLQPTIETAMAAPERWTAVVANSGLDADDQVAAFFVSTNLSCRAIESAPMRAVVQLAFMRITSH
jgi:hypothetical protein